MREVWPFVAHLVARAVRRGRNGDFAEIARGVLAGPDLLWVIWDGEALLAAGVSGLRIEEGRKVCVILAMAGEAFPRWAHTLGAFERWARSEGCAAVRIHGRRGWRRVLRDYRSVQGHIEKELYPCQAAAAARPASPPAPRRRAIPGSAPSTRSAS